MQEVWYSHSGHALTHTLPPPPYDKHRFLLLLPQPLFNACMWGHVDVVRVLLAAGSNANTGDSSGNTPLMMATEAGNVDVVSALIEAKATVDITNEVGLAHYDEHAQCSEVFILKCEHLRALKLDTYHTELQL